MVAAAMSFPQEQSGGYGMDFARGWKAKAKRGQALGLCYARQLRDLLEGYLFYQGGYYVPLEHAESQVEAKMPCCWTESNTNRWMVRRVYMGSAAKLACIFLVGCFLLYASLWRETARPDDMFRASDAIETAYARYQFYNRYGPQLRDYLRVHQDARGVSAPNLRVYKQYLALRMPDGSIRPVFNPRIVSDTPIEGLSDATYYEHEDSMCDPDAMPLHVPRHRSIVLEFDTEHMDGVVELLVIDDPTTAACVQHFADIFRGVWPCGRGRTSKTPLVLLPRPLDMSGPQSRDL
jgi:peptide deformylase